MHMKTILNVILAAALSAGASISAIAAEPAAATGDMPLSAILQSVEKDGRVVSVERERNRWELLVCSRRGSCNELYLDPVTGRELRRQREATFDRLPPADAKPLSAVVAALEQQNLGAIMEIDFDDRLWEIDVLPGEGRRIELYVDPVTGAIVRCRGGSGCPAV
jgi:uncharacterized iron-regulated membrane protein